MLRFSQDENNAPIDFDILLSYLNDAFRILSQAYLLIASDRKTNPYQKPEKTKTWHIENVITEELVDLAEEITIAESLNFDWINEDKDLKLKNRIDIDIVYQSGLGKSKRLGIECKHLINNSKNQSYVKEGIQRFETGKYAAKMPIAGMLGYIEKGKTSPIVEDINSKLKASQLQSFGFPHKINDTFQSIHDRSKQSDCVVKFKLYHLFLDFNELILRK